MEKTNILLKLIEYSTARGILNSEDDQLIFIKTFNRLWSKDEIRAILRRLNSNELLAYIMREIGGDRARANSARSATRTQWGPQDTSRRTFPPNITMTQQSSQSRDNNTAGNKGQRMPEPELYHDAEDDQDSWRLHEARLNTKRQFERARNSLKNFGDSI